MVLREEEGAGIPSERLLQQVWLHQRLVRETLCTRDGRPLLVLHPGFWNREAGPDFRQAVLQFGDRSAQVGDVEIDLHPQGWTQHRHQSNPAYRNVRLHVVWEAPVSPVGTLPTLATREYLDAPLRELADWFSGLNPSRLPAFLHGACAEPLTRLAARGFEELLRQAARVRLEHKAAVARARARQAGWEQALWEGIFGALGYKHNLWPMRRLAELLPGLRVGDDGQPVPTRQLQARLLGLAGLLPSELSRVRPTVDAYLRATWDEWWRERGRFLDQVTPRALWHLHGLRPANHPARRLALVAHWLTDRGWLDRLDAWLTGECADRRLAGALLECWQVETDPFWSHHWTLNSGRLPHPRPLLGLQRVTDLAMNVVLPWFWSRAQAGGNPALAGRIEHRYFAWPAGQDNAVLRLARERLLAGAKLPSPRRAADQQGLLQIVRDFCAEANPLCEACPFPDLVRAAGESFA